MAVRDVVQAAAGVGGEEATYVEDVFSTYLYTGNGSTQIIENGIALGDFGVGTSTQFGSTDGLTYSGVPTGMVDSSTFTVSFWINNRNTGANPFAVRFGGTRFFFYVKDGRFQVAGRNSSATSVLSLESAIGTNPDKWAHVLFSCSLGVGYKLYVNDVNVSMTQSTFTSGSIHFSRTGEIQEIPSAFEGKMAHFFFDYTYRDLTVEANRRYFIDANGGSTPTSTLTALNPLLYFPMTEDYSIGENLGTGGDFTVTGSPTIVQSGTQYEAGYGQGGMAWIKSRSAATDHQLFDTERGVTKELISNSSAAETTDTDTLTAFNADGFSLGADSRVNTNAATYTSWTFRKAPKFFDVVTYTGDGVAGRQISHSLGTRPGFIIVKRTDTGNDPYNNWNTAHIDGSNLKSMYLNLTSDGSSTPWIFWSDSSTTTAAYAAAQQTSTYFTVGSLSSINGSGGSFVAYLFAHNDGDGEFGETGDQDIIKCGSYTGNGSSNGPIIDLGWEPQWLMVKNASTSDWGWYITDVMRGFSETQYRWLAANLNNEEANLTQRIRPLANGFQPVDSASPYNGSGNTYIYIAIRRGPMKTPESGTEVFAPILQDFDGFVNTGFVTDLIFGDQFTGGNNWRWLDRLRGGSKPLSSNTTSAEGSESYWKFDYNTGVALTFGGTIPNWMWYNLRRAPGFFDVVAYEGNGTAGRTVAHNLGVAPEMIMVKQRDATRSWYIGHSGLNVDGDSLPWTDVIINFNTSAPIDLVNAWNDTSPDASNFTVGNGTAVNSAAPYIAYLFATLPGISKVGSYTGTAADLNVDCGFSAGARFILIKRTDSTGDWYVWDSVRGITAGNDPYLLLNSTAAENTSTDYIDPLSSGFTVTSAAPAALNASGGTYIFLAIA